MLPCQRHLFDIPEDCVAIVSSASYGVATAALNLPVRKGQRILVLDGLGGAFGGI